MQLRPATRKNATGNWSTICVRLGKYIISLYKFWLNISLLFCWCCCCCERFQLSFDFVSSELEGSRCQLKRQRVKNSSENIVFLLIISALLCWSFLLLDKYERRLGNMPHPLFWSSPLNFTNSTINNILKSKFQKV